MAGPAREGAQQPLLSSVEDGGARRPLFCESGAFLQCKLWVPASIFCGCFVSAVNIIFGGAAGGGPSLVLTRLSQVCGWSYFFAWSASFYPQTFLNYRRKSVAGLSFDYQVLNIFGYMAYFAFNVALFWSPHVQNEYRRAHDGKASAVRLNDVLFAGHAFVLTAVTLFQIYLYWDYPELKGKALLLRKGVLISLAIFSAVVLICLGIVIVSHEKWLDWYSLLSILSEAKLVISICKYIPQVLLNWRRKSTLGWNIHNVLLDFTGGILSVAQLCLDAANFGDSSLIFGDPVKLFLGALTIFFDIVFMLQHYVLYAPERDLR